MKTKICTKCRQKLSGGEFYKDQTKKGGLSSHCRKCARLCKKLYREKNRTKLAQREKEYRKKNPAKVAQRQKEAYKKNREKIQRRHKEYYRENRDKILRKQKLTHNTEHGRKASRRLWIKRSYGLTLEAHQQIYLNQNGCCLICDDPISYSKIHTDHNHDTGEVRGLLCCHCNRMLGAAKDNPVILRRAIKYLKGKG